MVLIEGCVTRKEGDDPVGFLFTPRRVPLSFSLSLLFYPHLSIYLYLPIFPFFPFRFITLEFFRSLVRAAFHVRAVCPSLKRNTPLRARLVYPFCSLLGQESTRFVLVRWIAAE